MTEETVPKRPALRFCSKASCAVLIVILLVAAAYTYNGGRVEKGHGDRKTVNG